MYQYFKIFIVIVPLLFINKSYADQKISLISEIDSIPRNIDTVFIFNPLTYEEQVIIKYHEDPEHIGESYYFTLSGKDIERNDTTKIFDSKSNKEIIYIQKSKIDESLLGLAGKYPNNIVGLLTKFGTQKISLSISAPINTDEINVRFQAACSDKAYFLYDKKHNLIKYFIIPAGKSSFDLSLHTLEKGEYLITDDEEHTIQLKIH